MKSTSPTSASGARLRRGVLAATAALAVASAGTVAHAEGHRDVTPPTSSVKQSASVKPHVILSTDMPPVKNGIPGGE
ncbi:hypothetical protein, partial [Streptomyces heilongjiangensis]